MKKTNIVKWGLWFAALFIMFYLLPKAGDDWVFYTPEGIKGLYQKSVTYYLNENGRILGNFFAYLFADHVIGASVFKASVVCGISYLLWRAMPRKFSGSLSVVIIMCLWLPGNGEMFAQTYAWSAGFYNYVIPAVFFVASFLLLTKAFEKDTGKNSIRWIFLYGGISFLGQFFAEFYSTYVVIIALFLMLVYWFSRKHISVLLTAYTVGAAAGAICMFLSPVYGRVATDKDHYRTMSLSLKDIVNTAKDNYVEISRNVIRENYWVIILMSLFCIILLLKNGNFYRKWGRIVRNVLIFGLTIVPCYYIVASRMLTSQFVLNSSLKIYVDFGITIIYYIAVCVACIYEIRDIIVKWKCVYLLVSFIILAAPLFVVTPIGARCFYVLYIDLALLAIHMLSYLVQINFLKPEYFLIPLFAVTLVTIFSFEIIAFYQNMVNNEKCFYIEQEIKKGHTLIEVPCFMYPQYIHEPETEKISYRYYVKEPWDIEWKYIPYDEWKDKYNSLEEKNGRRTFK